MNTNSSHRGTTVSAASGYRAVVTLGITLLAAVAAFFCLNMGEAHAAGWGCVGTLSNPTPCTVTHAEFRHVGQNMTRHQVHEAFGVTGHRVGLGTYNYPDGDFHLAITYPAPGGDATVIFEDRGDGRLTLTSKLWQAPR